MEIQRLKALRRGLDVFVSHFGDCIKTVPSRRHMRTYIAGQVSDLERKNAAAIALEAGVPPRSLQEFLAIHRWNERTVGERVQEIVAGEHADPNAIGVIDETSFEKKGDKTAGVQRQYCGASGKIDNCVVTVHLGYVGGDFHALVDSDVYLPEAWLEDRARCREAGIPDEVVYRPKWRIALDLLRHTLGKGVPVKYLAADEEYGRCGLFRAGVEALELLYVVEVPCALTVWTKRPRVAGPPRSSAGVGRPRTRPELAAGAPSPRRVDRLWKHGGPSWRGFHVKNTQKGPVVWEARTTRFSPWTTGGLPGKELWLIVARNVLEGEVKYFLSNAPADTPVARLLHVAFRRDHIEKLFEESKGEVGLDHFEARGYRAVKRHLILSMVSLLFLAEQTQALRGEESVVEPLPGPSGHRSATGP